MIYDRLRSHESCLSRDLSAQALSPAALLDNTFHPTFAAYGSGKKKNRINRLLKIVSAGDNAWKIQHTSL